VSAAERVEQLRLLHRWAEAERAARTALAAEPDDPRLLAALAAVLRDTRRYRKGLAAAEAACAADPGYAYAHQLRALLLDDLYRCRQAEAAAEVYVSLVPEDAHAWGVLSYIQLRSGHRAYALRSAQRAVELDPESSEARLDVARVRAAMGDEEAAAEGYREALSLDPHRVDALRGLAGHAARSSRPGRALAELATFGMLNPSIPEVTAGVVAHLRTVAIRLAVVLVAGGFVAVLAFSTPFTIRRPVAALLLVVAAGLVWGGRRLPRGSWPVLLAGLRSSVPLCLAYAHLVAEVLVYVAILVTGDFDLGYVTFFWLPFSAVACIVGWMIGAALFGPGIRRRRARVSAAADIRSPGAGSSPGQTLEG
jgi:tetratricopeptide (TPR) repeat protein